MTANTQTRIYMGGGVLLLLFGVYWALEGKTSEVTYETVEGISVFAALYVIAQAAERVTEWVVDGLSLLPASPEKRKEDALREIRAANSTLNGNPTLADLGAPQAEGARSAVEVVTATVAKKEAGEAKVAEARRDIKFLAHGVSLTVCALAVNALNYGLLDHVGAMNVKPGVDRLLTVVAAAGGTKALHELIGRVQKAKESSESSTEAA